MLTVRSPIVSVPRASKLFVGNRFSEGCGAEDESMSVPARRCISRARRGLLPLNTPAARIVGEHARRGKGMSEGHAPGLVGRGHELAQLDAALAAALTGRGRLVVLTGEPGIGKTALARAFVERAAARGAHWAWGTCWDRGGAPAYWPWVQIVRAIARTMDVATLRALLGGAAPLLAELLPELAGDGAPG